MKQEEPQIGVYICHCGGNISDTVDVERVKDAAAKFKGVKVAEKYEYVCSDPGQKMITEGIKEHGLNRIVVASCSPRMHLDTFRRNLQSAGLNPFYLEMANIREQCSWVHDNKEDATSKAIDLVRGAVERAYYLYPLHPSIIPINKDILVIGGGVAGIMASIELADKGYQVYLVEKSPSIGGKMAQLSKTFPTLDCSQCILTPKMVYAQQHPNIEIISKAELTAVEGSPGNFRVLITKQPRYVDLNCTACGECAEKCSVKVPSEFQADLTDRKAVYTPFTQAVPRTWSIDKDHCMYLTKGTCYPLPVILPPEKWQEFTSENVGLVPEVNGVFQLFDGEKLIVLISGVPNLRKGLKEKLETVEKARYFTYEEHPMYTMRESELISKFLKEHNRLPELNDELADLF